MGVPSPAIPTVSDGSLLHATTLNAYGSNLTNLYNYMNAGFFTQKPCVIANQTSTQSVSALTNTLCSFQTAPINTNTPMYVASQPTQLTVQYSGIYLFVGQMVFPQVAAPTTNNYFACQIMANGTNPVSNSIGATSVVMEGNSIGGSGTIVPVIAMANLSAGAAVYLNIYAGLSSGSVSTSTAYGGCYLAAIFLTPST